MRCEIWFSNTDKPHYIYKDKLPMTEKNVTEFMKKTFVNNKEDTNYYNVQQAVRIRIVKDKDWGD